MSNLESMDNNVPNQDTDMAKVHELMEEANQGMVAMSSEGEKKSYDDGQGGRTILMTEKEHADWIDANRHNA